ncbi:MAG: exodeoxyribonuclease V subunit gamma [Candidatus Binataceae bacterium]
MKRTEPPMIRVHHSNRLENLISPLANAIAESQRIDPLRTIPIVVSGRAAANFASFALAERIGIAANLEFPFLRRYLAKIAEAADPATKILDAGALRLILFECMRGKHGGDPELAPVRDYANAGAPSDREARMLQLAGQAARLFREYSISRREMLKSWTAAKSAAPKTAVAAERWQRHLWRCVFDADGRVRPEWTRDANRRRMMLPEAYAAIDPKRIAAEIGAPLHVFALSDIGLGFVEIFARMAQAAEVSIYALNPCREFWEDLDTSRRQWRSTLDSSEAPFEFAQADPLALRMWGRPGREHIRLLGALTDCDFEPHFFNAESAPKTILRAIQEDILNRAPARANAADRSAAGDGSIRFLACPGIRREVEIVADEIWSLVLDNENLAGAGKAERLRFHEIAVLAPDDSFDRYLPHLEAVFRDRDRLPLNLTGGSSSGGSRVTEAIEMLLRLPLGRFTRGETMALLTHPAILGAEAASDADAWRAWIEQLGVYFGASRDDLKSTYIGEDLFNWDQALRRLSLGAFMAGGPDDANAEFVADDARYVPAAVPDGATGTIARMVRTARSIIADADAIREMRLEFTEWTALLAHLILKYVRTDDPHDERARDRCVSALEEIAAGDLRGEPVGYAAAHEIAAAQIAEAAGRGGNFAPTGVAAGPLSALRAIPFKAIFPIGMDAGAFPAAPQADRLDLRRFKRRIGDVSPLERDRYLFLETILAARERICFSYTARDAQTGDPLEASPLVRELQYLMRGYADPAAIDTMTIKHRMSRYDLSYFSNLPGVDREESARGLKSFDGGARRGAAMAALRRNLEAHVGPIPAGVDPIEAMPEVLREKVRRKLHLVEPPRDFAQAGAAREEISISLSALTQFLKCPLQAAARHALGMIEDEEPPEDIGDEPLEQSRLARAMLLREVFWESGGDAALVPERYAELSRIARVQGRAPAGLFASGAEVGDLAMVRGWIEQARENGALARWENIRIGRAGESFRADRALDPIVLEIPVGGPHGKARPAHITIHGAVRGVTPGRDLAIQCVLRDSAKPVDFLPLAMLSVALSAAGEPIAPEFCAIVAGKDGAAVRKFTPLNRAAAREYLAALAEDLLSGGVNYFLPIEAVTEAIKAKRGGDPIAAIEKVRGAAGGEYHSCASDYGPLRKEVAHGFAPPDSAQLDSILERRFAPIAAIFAGEKDGNGK